MKKDNGYKVWFPLDAAIAMHPDSKIKSIKIEEVMGSKKICVTFINHHNSCSDKLEPSNFLVYPGDPLPEEGDSVVASGIDNISATLGKGINIEGVARPVSYTHLTLPTNREV